MYFQVHQPHRIKRYGMFDIGVHSNYFDDEKNEQILHKVARKCYVPTNKLLLDLIQRHGKDFKFSFSITGTIIDQLERFAPDVLQTFKDLAETGQVEFLAETYYHSLAYLHSEDEFKKQVDLHRQKMEHHFGQTPQVFRNTELIFNNQLAKTIEEMGFKGILAEGADHILGWRSPNFVYKPAGPANIKLLLKNYKLSDDIAFRFSNKQWEEHPLTVDKYGQWISAVNGSGELINLFMDYETFGEHQWEDTGIFQFLDHMPGEVLRHPDNNFITVSEAVDRYDVKGEFDAHNYISWADMERDLTAWLGNRMQQASMDVVFDLEDDIMETNDESLINDWRRLTTSDHFYYMCTKWFADGDVHKYFNAFDSPYEAYIAFMNVMQDVKLRLERLQEAKAA